MTRDELASNLVKGLFETGKPVEAGWQIYRLFFLKLPFHEPSYDLQEAFFVGAEYTFNSMISALDPGEEPTEDDMRRMELLKAEIDQISSTLQLKYEITVGRS